MFPVAVAFLTTTLAVPQRYMDAFVRALASSKQEPDYSDMSPYPNGCSQGRGGPCGSVPWGAPGRRRAEVLASADVALCTNVHAYVREHHLDKLINALVNGATDTAEGAVSSSVAEWCATNAASFNTDDDDDRRRVETQWDAYEAMLGLDLGAQVKDDPEHGSEEYLTKVHEIANESRRLAHVRRLTQQTEEDVELPAEMWQQCAGYAFAINKMVTTIDGTGSFAAAIFAMSTSGGPSENMNACGAVVNSVNDALENGVLEGMHKQEDGSVMIAASHPDALQFEQLGLKTISFTIGGVLQAGYMIMKICTSYQSQIAIV